jgi:hypothetical protein
MKLPLLVIVVTLALSAPPARGQEVATSAKDVLAKADAYLAAYREQLRFLLADEHYVQQVSGASGAVSARRVMSGDLFVTYIPADRAWVAVHDTAEVDGRPVDGHENIRALLERDSVSGVARQLVNRNARFNIGSVVRNFNEPTLGLLVLDPQRRSQFKFDRRGVTRVQGATLVTLAFRETEPPTLVRASGRELYSKGEMVIEAETGRIRRTSMELTYNDIHARLTSFYARNADLNLWLPATFVERYERGSRRELISCVATYTNWRRFDVDVKFAPR